MFRSTSCYPSSSHWDTSYSAELTQQKSYMQDEIHKLKKSHDLLRKEKRELEILLAKSNNEKKNYTNIPDDFTCIVCLQNVKTGLFLECLHLVTCKDCLKKVGDTCPLCRTKSKKVNLYL